MIDYRITFSYQPPSAELQESYIRIEAESRGEAVERYYFLRETELMNDGLTPIRFSTKINSIEEES